MRIVQCLSLSLSCATPPAGRPSSNWTWTWLWHRQKAKGKSQKFFRFAIVSMRIVIIKFAVHLSPSWSFLVFPCFSARWACESRVRAVDTEGRAEQIECTQSGRRLSFVCCHVSCQFDFLASYCCCSCCYCCLFFMVILNCNNCYDDVHDDSRPKQQQ